MSLSSGKPRGTIAEVRSHRDNNLFLHRKKVPARAPAQPCPSYGDDGIVFREKIELSIPSSVLSSPRSNKPLRPDSEHIHRCLGNTHSGKSDTARPHNSRPRNFLCLNHNLRPV